MDSWLALISRHVGIDSRYSRLTGNLETRGRNFRVADYPDITKPPGGPHFAMEVLPTNLSEACEWLLTPVFRSYPAEAALTQHEKRKATKDQRLSFSAVVTSQHPAQKR
jgi:hypothetical protein